jgi:K(+)-stimulated pyrophosphate-energized sodium pump
MQEIYCASIVAVGAIGLAVMGSLFKKILSINSDIAERIAGLIRSGAMTFLYEEYKIIAVGVAIVAAIVGYFLHPLAAVTFIAGSAISLTTGFLGMRGATYANVRTTMAAKNTGERAAFLIALLAWQSSFIYFIAIHNFS